MPLLVIIPFGYREFIEINWSILPYHAFYRIGYVVLFTTFFAYMFNLFAIRKLKPTTVSIFIYLQPVFASSYALFVGSDSLNSLKILATILIFVGVYLVSRKPKQVND
jgi:drug/metabolite transporter (DMT)-like permease